VLSPASAAAAARVTAVAGITRCAGDVDASLALRTVASYSSASQWREIGDRRPDSLTTVSLRSRRRGADLTSRLCRPRPCVAVVAKTGCQAM